MLRFADRQEENVVRDVLKTLDRWYIAASGDGRLWIQPRQPELKLQDFCILLKRVHRLFNDQRFDVMVFHFDGVEVPRSLWLIVLRLLSAFAKTVQTDCRIIRSIKVNSPPTTTADRMEPHSESSDSESPSRPKVKLNGISVIIEPRASGAKQP